MQRVCRSFELRRTTSPRHTTTPHAPPPQPLHTDEFEREREELLRAVARCGVQAAELHRAEWEGRQRADEVAELQRALGDAQQALFDERSRLLALQAENDGLKLRELDDRRRIQQLLAACGGGCGAPPMEQSVALRADGGPAEVLSLPADGGGGWGAGGSGVGARLGGAGVSPSKQRRGGGGGGSGPGGSGAAAAAAAGVPPGGVVRTVFLPAGDPSALALKVEALQAQLDEQRALHEERVEALLADRRVREEEAQRQRAAAAAAVEALSAKVEQLEDALRASTRDYLEGARLWAWHWKWPVV